MSKRKPPTPAPAWFGLSGRIRRSVSAALYADGWRYCAAHNDHAGAVLPLDRFTRSDTPKLCKLAGYCRECTKEYYKGRK